MRFQTFRPLLFPVLLTALASGCAQQDQSKFAERAEAEGRGANKAGQEYLAERAREMEADLSSRQDFYGAIEGRFEGTARHGDQTFKIKLNLARSIPPFLGGRIRQLSEIENDLNSLSFHIQIVQWHADEPASAVGCRVSQIRPDMKKGTILIASPDCPNLYTLYLDDSRSEDTHPPAERARDLAEKLRGRQLSVVDSLKGFIQPTSNAAVFDLSVKRVEGDRQ